MPLWALGMPTGIPNAHPGIQEEILDACLPPCPPHWGTSWSNLDQQFAMQWMHRRPGKKLDFFLDPWRGIQPHVWGWQGPLGAQGDPPWPPLDAWMGIRVPCRGP